MPAVYGIGQGKAVHRGTTAHVQQNCPLLAAGQAGGIKHVQRFRRAGQAQGNQVCLRQLGVQFALGYHPQAVIGARGTGAHAAPHTDNLGPKGMGALYCRKGIWPQNLIDGGSQEARHRAGTENVAGIAGMGKALELATTDLEKRMAHEQELRDYVIGRILKNIPEARLNGGLTPRLPGNVNISFPGLEGETILLDLDMHNICASTGSACNSDSLDPSHVLLSIGVPEEIGHGSMRFTFGPQNTMEEAKYLCDVLEEVIPRRRAMSCMWLQGQNTARHFSLKGEQ